MQHPNIKIFLNWMIRLKQKFNRIQILQKLRIIKVIIITITILIIILNLILMKFLQQACQIIKQKNIIFNK